MDPLLEKIAASPTAKQWKTIGIKPHHGINVPLFSLHTEHTCGIGEFYDLVPLIDWCHELELDVIQLLPINDCGSDPSPYNAISAYAINPIYLSLTHLPYVDKHTALKERLPSMRNLTKTPRVALHEVKVHKMAWLRKYFSLVAPLLMKTQAFMDFVAKNAWIESYGLFKVLKDRTEQYIWTTWPREYKNPTKEEYDKLVEDNLDEITFYILLQFLCFKQLSDVKKYANMKGVFLKGDIPILISPDSCDVWHEPEIFDTSIAIGAPPDAYNENGQHWGFPLYRWNILRETNFAWWRQRLKAATPLYNIYRVDHIIGFFRLWVIPPSHTPKEGHFVPTEEIQWASQGKELLKMMLASSPLFPIVEDLGVLIPIVRSTLDDLSVCGTRVMRWERRGKNDREIIPIDAYSPLTMTTVSTHDSEPLSLWWREKKDEAKLYANYKGWNYRPKITPQQIKEILWESHHTSSLFHINLLGEYLAIFPEMVWPKLEDERINIPGTMQPSNWTYRFRLSLEEITSNAKLKEVMRQIVHSTTPPTGE